MNFSFNIVDWQAVAPGLTSVDEWRQWAQQPAHIDANAPLAHCQLPVMTRRRMSQGSCHAVECGLALLHRQQVDALVFGSRHGELENNFHMLRALAQKESLSPTDFVMSVHNAAAASLTIIAKTPLVSTSLSAGVDTFQQGLCEVSALQASGYQRVLLVDFDGTIPAFYQPYLPAIMPCYPHAVALLLDTDKVLHCQARPITTQAESILPQSLQFLHGWLAGRRTFQVTGERLSWHWCR